MTGKGRALNICQVTPVFPYKEQLTGERAGGRYRVGGIGQLTLDMAAHLARRGHRITVFSVKAPDHKKMSEVPIEGVTVKRLSPLLPVHSASIPLGLLFALAPGNYDLIHAHTPVPAIAELAALRNLLRRRPFLLTYHNDLRKRGLTGRFLTELYYLSLGPLALSHSTAIITSTRSYAAGSKRLRQYGDKDWVIPCPVNVDRFSPAVGGREARRRYGLTEKDKVVLFVGIHDEYKGLEYLVRAMPQVMLRVPEARLMLVGTGPAQPRLKEIAGQLGISPGVLFTGFVPQEDLPSVYAACDIFVLPSVSVEEGFGIVQLEAMATGKPVVSTSLPGVSEVDAGEVATAHVPPKDEAALAEAIAAILSDSGRADAMGRRGRELVIGKYSLDRVAQRQEEVYFEVLEQWAARRVRK